MKTSDDALPTASLQAAALERRDPGNLSLCVADNVALYVEPEIGWSTCEHGYTYGEYAIDRLSEFGIYEQMRKAKSTSVCMDCGKWRDLEYYMLTHDRWAEVTQGEERDGFLCLSCVEARLGRSLQPCDFMFTPLEMRARLRLPRGGMRAWDRVLGKNFTRHYLFELLAKDAKSARAIAERITELGRRTARRKRPYTMGGLMQAIEVVAAEVAGKHSGVLCERSG